MSATSARARPAWLPRLTRRGGMFLAVGGALFLNALVINRRDLLFVACLLLVVPAVALVYVTIRPARMRVTRTFRPAIVPAGTDAVVSLQLRNLSLRPLYGARWRDTASDGLLVPPGGPLPGLDRYEGGPSDGADSVRLEYTVTPLRRGLYACGPLMLGRHDPFGLAVSERSVGEPHDLVVTPRVTALPGHRLSAGSGDGTIRDLVRQSNPNSDELIAREYRPGDPLRRVNWPATARHGEIMVRQEEQRSNPEARIILDTTLAGRPEYASTQGGDRARRHEQAFELAIELTASVGLHLLENGFLLEVVELGRSQLAPGTARGQGGLHGDPPTPFLPQGGGRLLLEGLANLAPVQRTAPDESAGGAAARALGGRMPTFAVLTDIDAQDATELVALRGQCNPAVAFILDTMSRSVVERLRDAGWTCVGLRSPRDIAAAWDQATSERGAVRDLA